MIWTVSSRSGEALLGWLSSSGREGLWEAEPDAGRCKGTRLSSWALHVICVLRAFSFVAADTESNRRSTVSGRIISRYLPRLKVSRIKSATPQKKLAISLWFIARCLSSLATGFRVARFMLLRIGRRGSGEESVDLRGC